MTSSFDHIYISPHLDDAVLSCGGLIHRQTNAGQSVLVVSLYTAGLASSDLSPSLRNMHAVWGFADQDPFETRRTEDIAAVTLLGAEYQQMGWHGALYRRTAEGAPFYRGLSYFGPAMRSDRQAQLERIRQLMIDLRAQHPNAVVYAPLAIGEHVDHVLTYTAARQIGGPVCFYEDVPYVQVGNLGPVIMRLLAMLSRRGMVAANYGAGGAAGNFVATVQAKTSLFSGPGLTLRLRGTGGGLSWRSTQHDIDLAAKLAVVEQYATQLPMVLGSSNLARQAITRYANHLGRGIPAERLWRLA